MEYVTKNLIGVIDKCRLYFPDDGLQAYIIFELGEEEGQMSARYAAAC